MSGSGDGEHTLVRIVPAADQSERYARQHAALRGVVQCLAAVVAPAEARKASRSIIAQAKAEYRRHRRRLGESASDPEVVARLGWHLFLREGYTGQMYSGDELHRRLSAVMEQPTDASPEAADELCLEMFGGRLIGWPRIG